MSLSEEDEHAWYSHLWQNVLVWNVVLPGDAQKPSKTIQMEGIEYAFLAGVKNPCRFGTPSSWCWWPAWCCPRPSLLGRPASGDILHHLKGVVTNGDAEDTAVFIETDSKTKLCICVQGS